MSFFEHKLLLIHLGAKCEIAKDSNYLIHQCRCTNRATNSSVHAHLTVVFELIIDGE